MHSRSYLSLLRKRWLYVAIPMILGVGITAALSFIAQPMFRSTASVYFALPTGNTAADLFQGSNYTESQLASYASVATKPVVLSPVIQQLSLEMSVNQLSGFVTATVSNQTVIIDISASDPSANRAASIANAVANQLGKVVRDLSPKNTNGKPTIDYAVVANASAPQSPASPRKKFNIAAGLIGGLLLGIVLALTRDRFDTRIRTPSDLGDLPALASVPHDKSARTSPVIVGSHEKGRRAEAFRRLRTNLQFVDVGRPVHVITVTSSIADEGKSSSAANLALVFAEAGRRVLLIEADLRRPKVADYLGLDRSVGLTNVLSGQVKLSEVIQTWGAGSFSVLPSGSIPPNPSELLSSQGMHDLLSAARSEFDLIVIDTPPLLPVTDGAVVAVQTDGAILVVRFGKVNSEQVGRAVQSLAAVDARILGTVLNRVPTRGVHAAGDYEGYGYQEPKSKFSRRRNSLGLEK